MCWTKGITGICGAPPEAFARVRDALGAEGIRCRREEIAMLANQQVRVTGPEARRVLRLLEALEDHEDVIHVWANLEMNEEELHAAS